LRLHIGQFLVDCGQRFLNRFEGIGYVKNALYIRPRVAQPVSTYAEPRTTPHANFNFLTWAAMGLQIRKDFNGRSKVFNGYGTQTAL
jgi:hypothetical protein